MKIARYFQGFRRCLQGTLAFGTVLLALTASGRAAVWTNADDRNYDGQGKFVGAYWSYGYVPPDANGNGGHVGNWSGGPYPGNGVADATLGAPADTICNVAVSLNSLTLTSAGALSMNFSSSLTVASTLISRDGTLAIGGGGGFFPIYTNTGTFRKSAGTGTFTIASDLVFNSRPGTKVVVDSGTLLLSGGSGLLDGVTFDPAVGTIIDLVSTGVNNFQGRIGNAARAGTVRLSRGTMAGTQRFLDHPQPCTLAFTGSVFQWTGGVLGNYQQGALFTNTGTINLSGNVDKTNFATLTNSSQIIQTGTGNLVLGNANSGGSLTNSAGATYDLRSDSAISTGGGNGNFITNRGLLKKSAGTGTSTITASLPFNLEGGTVEVDTGTLLLPDYGTSTGGTFKAVAAGTVLDIGGNGSYSGTYTGSGAGSVRYSKGNLNTVSPGATWNFPGALFQWTGGVMGNYQRGNIITNAGTMTLSGSAGKVTYATFTNNGTMLLTGTGNLEIGQANSGGSMTNSAKGIFNLQSDADLPTDYTFTNAGLFEKTAGTGVSSVRNNFTNTGTVAAKTGTLDFTGNIAGIAGSTLTGGIWEVSNGATLKFSNYSGGISINKSDVTLDGVNAQFPAINPLADNQGAFSLLTLRQFTTVGALSNTGTLVLDAGTALHVKGAYTSSGSKASLEVVIGGAATSGAGSPGLLQVSGTAAVSGNLVLSFVPGITLPSSSAVLTILTASAPVTGSFVNAPNGSRLETDDGRGSFLVKYGPGSNTVTLSSFTAGTYTPPAFFTGQVALGNGVYYLQFPNGTPFGYYSYLDDPNYIYHFDLGYEYVFDAADGVGGVYFYDFLSGHFFYTSPTFPFPYLYDFTLNSVLYYYPDTTKPGHYTTAPRYFYNFTTGKIFTQ